MTKQKDLCVLPAEEPLPQTLHPTGTLATGIVGRVIGDATLALLGGVVGRLLLYVAQFMLARWLGPVDFGLFSLALSVTQVASVVAGFGLYLAVVRFTAIYAGEDTANRAWNLLIWAGRIVGTASGLAALTMLAWPAAWAGLLREADLARVLPIMGAALPALTLTRLVASSLNGLGRARLRSVIESALPSLLFLAGIIVLQVSQRLDLRTTAGAHLLSWLMAAVSGGWLVRRRLRLPGQSDAAIDRTRIVRFALPAWASAILNQVSQRLDILLAGFLLGGADLGVYSAASLVIVAMSFVMTAFNMAAAPSFANWHGGDNREMVRLYRDGTRLLLTFGLVVGLILILGASELMHLLGDEFEVGQVVLVVLVLGQLANLSVGSAGTILVMTDHQKIELSLLFGSISLNVVVATCTVPALGLVGLALAAALATVALNLARLAAVYVVLGVHPYHISYAKPLTAAVVAGGAGLGARLLARTWNLPDFLGLIFLTTILAVVHLLALSLLGLERAERDILASGWRRLTGWTNLSRKKT